VVHERLAHGEERRVDPRLGERLSRQFGLSAPPGEQFAAPTAQPLTDEEYVDALDPSHDRWLGGFFPVGRTGFVIAVQTAYSRAARLGSGSEALLALNLGFLLFGLCVIWVASRTARAAVEEQRPAPASADSLPSSWLGEAGPGTPSASER
jgi:hypothetical protein